MKKQSLLCEQGFCLCPARLGCTSPFLLPVFLVSIQWKETCGKVLKNECKLFLSSRVWGSQEFQTVILAYTVRTDQNITCFPLPSFYSGRFSFPCSAKDKRIQVFLPLLRGTLCLLEFSSPGYLPTSALWLKNTYGFVDYLTLFLIVRVGVMFLWLPTY